MATYSPPILHSKYDYKLLAWQLYLGCPAGTETSNEPNSPSVKSEDFASTKGNFSWVMFSIFYL